MATIPRRIALAGVTLGALALAGGAAAQDSMRCDGGLVAVGDTKLDLLGKCGGPTLVEERLEERRGGGGGGGRLRVSTTVERWTYNAGPNQFVQYVTLDTGRIVAIVRGGYGYALPADPPAPPLPRARCEPNGFHVGDTTFDVLARCGAPATRDARLENEVQTATVDGKTVVTGSRTVTVEAWAYDFGPSTFVRLLTFADGVLRRVDTGSYGYAR